MLRIIPSTRASFSEHCHSIQPFILGLFYVVLTSHLLRVSKQGSTLLHRSTLAPTLTPVIRGDRRRLSNDARRNEANDKNDSKITT